MRCCLSIDGCWLCKKGVCPTPNGKLPSRFGTAGDRWTGPHEEVIGEGRPAPKPLLSESGFEAVGASSLCAGGERSCPALSLGRSLETTRAAPHDSCRADETAETGRDRTPRPQIVHRRPCLQGFDQSDTSNCCEILQAQWESDSPSLLKTASISCASRPLVASRRRSLAAIAHRSACPNHLRPGFAAHVTWYGRGCDPCTPAFTRPCRS